MNKTIIFVVLGLSLVLLLGSIGFRPGIYDPNSPPYQQYTNQRKYISTYEVVVGSDPNALAIKVNKRLNEDHKWRPIGGISVSDHKYRQAMAKVCP